MNDFVTCSAKNKYHCTMRVCLFYWYCYCHFTSYIIHNSRTDPWWCLYFHIISVWSLINIAIFKFVWTAKLDSRFLAGCIQGVFCMLCMSCEWKMCMWCVCYMKVYDNMWCYCFIWDCCGERVSLSDLLILNMNTVESQLSNLWFSSVLILSSISCQQDTVLHLSTFILQHLFYQRSNQNGINYTPHHVYVFY